METKGWKLSPNGVAACRELCKERGLSENEKNLVKVALDLDLRSTGEPTLPEIAVHSEPVKIQGPLVVQVQKVKNVAVSSGKQHQPSPSKRLLKLLLTDGHRNISAAETDGPVERLSPTTPPGTKIVLTGSITVVNGFLLLKNSSAEVLGGSVEPLLKKWKIHQALPDNLERARAEGESGPPQFVKFGHQKGGLEALAAGVRARKEARKEEIRSAQRSRPSPPPAESASTRTLMDLPASYRAQSGEGEKMVVRPGSKVGAQAAKRSEDVRKQTDKDARGSRETRPRQGIEEDAMDYVPPSKPDHLLGDFFQNLSLSSRAPAADDIEDLGRCVGRGRGLGSGRGRGGLLTRGRGRGGFADHHQERGEGRMLSDGRRGRGEQPGGEPGVRGRGRGRGRERDQDDYYPQRPKNSYQLSDFLTARESGMQEAAKRPKEDNVLDDYEYDPVSDSYYIQEKNFHTQDHTCTSSGVQARHNEHGRHVVDGGGHREEERGNRKGVGKWRDEGGERREHGRERIEHGREWREQGRERREQRIEHGREWREQGRERREHGGGRREEGRERREQGREKREHGGGRREEGRERREQRIEHGREWREQGRERREQGREWREQGGGRREEGRERREQGRREEGREKREYDNLSRDGKGKGEREPGGRGGQRGGPRQDDSYYGREERTESDRGKGGRERGRIEHLEGYGAGKRRGEGQSGGGRDRGGQRNLEYAGSGSGSRHGFHGGMGSEWQNNRTRVEKDNRAPAGPPADNMEDPWGHLIQNAGGVPSSAKKC